MLIFLSIVGVFIILFILIWFSSIRIELLFKREAENDRGEVKISAFGGIIRYRVEIPKLAWSSLDDGVTGEMKTKPDRIASKAAPSKTAQKKDHFSISKRTVEKAQDVYQEILHNVAFFQETVRRFLSKVTCEKLVWVTTVGTGDAAEAGVLTGIIWGIKSTLVGILGSYIRWDQPPQLYVDPNFNKAILEMQFHSIIRFRVGHAILAIKRLLSHMRKGRELKWQTTPFKA